MGASLLAVAKSMYYVHPRNSNHLRSHSTAIMALDHSGLGLENKFLENKSHFEMSANFAKIAKEKNFSCYVKRLSNKYGENSKNNKLHKILHLEREKVKEGFEMSANFAKIAKVTGIFLAK